MTMPIPEEPSDPKSIALAVAVAVVVAAGAWIAPRINEGIRWTLAVLVPAGSALYVFASFAASRRSRDGSSMTPDATAMTTGDGRRACDSTRRASLGGTRIAVFESRRARELARLVTRHGGVPIMVPALVEEPAPQSSRMADAVQPLLRGDIDLVIGMTGGAVDLLVAAANDGGKRDALLECLRATTIVCRGPKPAAALRAAGLIPTEIVREPHTTPHLIATLQPIDVDGKRVLILDGGDSSSAVAAALTARGASVSHVLLYRWGLPDDRREVMRRFIDQLLAGEVDAAAFTAQIQIRFLLATADAAGLGAAIRAQLASRVVVASVGPVCTAALAAEGIQAQVEPVHPKMGHMIVALAGHLSRRGSAT